MYERSGSRWVPSGVGTQIRMGSHSVNRSKSVVTTTAGRPPYFGPTAFRSVFDRSLWDLLKAFVKERLAPYKYPRYIEFIDELPKTATGKIQRFRLREREAGAR